MKQRIPNISDRDIKRIIKRDFPKLEFIKIECILKMYKSENDKGRNRVYASILKLSNGNFEMIKECVEKANNDYRDIIALSEYPNYSKHAFEDNLLSERKKQLIDDDWTQYTFWLNR